MTTPQEFAQAMRDQLGDRLRNPVEFRGESTLEVIGPEHIVQVCRVGKEQFGFDFLLDICSIDHYGDDPRWTVVYELYGLAHRCHLRLKVPVSEEKSELATVSGIWPTAEWHEREIFDMMGIRFTGHPDLRRILMWEGYPHHPLRKDFPLSGKPTEVPGVAFTRAAPMEGGPFVTTPGGQHAAALEPRVRETPEP